MALKELDNDHRFYMPDTWPFWLQSAVFFVILNAIMLGWVFTFPSGTVLTQDGQDLIAENVPWQAFNGAQLREGNVPLWNPHLFCGSPYLADLNCGFFYPFNWLSAVFPMDFCLNFILIAHFALAGWTASLWCRARGISTTASLLAGVIYTFCGVYFLHLVSGHIQTISVLVYTPVIFLSVEKILDTGRPRWILLGMAAVGLSIFTGFVQLIYYTGLAAMLFTLLRVAQALWALRPETRGAPVANEESSANAEAVAPAAEKQNLEPTVAQLEFRRLLYRVAMIGVLYAGGAAMGAIQLLPAQQTTPETVRSAGLTYEMASSCPEPPENLIVMFAADFWGATPGPSGKEPGAMLNGKEVPYFGRWYPNEVLPFMGVGALVLAIYGGIYGDKKLRQFAVTLALVCLVMSFGKHTPLYKLLFNHLPLYNSFRSANRWNVLTGLFIALLSGVGLDALLKRKDAPNAFALVVMIAAGVVYVGSLWLQRQADLGPTSTWAHILNFIASSKDALINTTADRYADADFIKATAMQASDSLLLPAALLVLCGAILFLVGKWPVVAYLLAVMAMGEVCSFAWRNTPTANCDVKRPAPWVNATSHLDPEDRVISNSYRYSNYGMVENYDDAYGYDPVVTLRYAEFLQNLQTDQWPQLRAGLDAGMNWIGPVVIAAGQTPDGRTVPVGSGRLWYLRVKHVLAELPSAQGQTALDINIPQNMPRALLLDNYDERLLVDDHGNKHTPTRSELFAAMDKPDFDPRKTVLLESAPDVEPDPTQGVDGTSTVRLTDLDTDRIEVTVDIAGPRLLLITDSYAKDWRAHSLDPDLPQKKYTVMPGDWTFRVIPLQAGHHHFMLEYRPKSFEQGRTITLATLVVWLSITAWPMRKRWPFVRHAPLRELPPGPAQPARIPGEPVRAPAPFAPVAPAAPAPVVRPVVKPAPPKPAPPPEPAAPAEPKPRAPGIVIPIPRFQGFHTSPPRRRPPQRPPGQSPPAAPPAAAPPPDDSAPQP